MKHTPGPWRVKDNGSMEGPHVYGPVHPVDGGDYAPLAGYHGGALSLADARLIAAAPELLEALTLLYEETADYIRLNNLGDVHHNRSMQYARDVIAKVGH